MEEVIKFRGRIQRPSPHPITWWWPLGGIEIGKENLVFSVLFFRKIIIKKESLIKIEDSPSVDGFSFVYKKDGQFGSIKFSPVYKDGIIKALEKFNYPTKGLSSG